MTERKIGPTHIQEQVSHLMKQGEKVQHTAVAVYGTSTQVLTEILTTGSIAPYPKEDMIAYQQQLTAGGEHLYYATPFYDRFIKLQPDVGRQMQRKYRHLDPYEELSVENVMQKAQMYALDKSLSNFYSQKLGQKIDTYTALYMMASLLPQVFRTFSQETYRLNTFAFESLAVLSASADKELVGSILRQFPQKVLRGVIRESIKPRGVLIYFSDAFFQGNRVLAGKETEGEIMVLSQKPLKASVMAGIAFLSKYDVQSMLPPR